MEIETRSTPKRKISNNVTYPLVLITNAIFASAGRKKCPLALAALLESIKSWSSLRYSAAYFLALSVAAFLAVTRSFLSCSRLVLRYASYFASLACFFRIFSGTLFALKQNTQGEWLVSQDLSTLQWKPPLLWKNKDGFQTTTSAVKAVAECVLIK